MDIYDGEWHEVPLTTDLPTMRYALTLAAESRGQKIRTAMSNYDPKNGIRSPTAPTTKILLVQCY